MTKSRQKKIKNLTQFYKEWDSLVSEIEAGSCFDDNSEKAKEKRIKKSEDDLLYFAKTYFPDYFRNKSPKFHKEWEELTKNKGMIQLVLASRGLSKSTFFTLVFALHGVLFGQSKFTLIGSYVEDKASVFTGRILLELKYNPRILNDFGDLIKSSLKKSVKHFSIISPIKKVVCTIKAISILQDPRGLISGPFRPDRVILDDVQNRKRAKSEKWVENALEWIQLDLIPALEPDVYVCIVVATPMHDNCLVCQLERGNEENEIDPVFTKKYPAIDSDGKLMWPERFPQATLDKLKKIMGEENFNQEFLLIPRALDSKIFDVSNVYWFSNTDIEDATRDLCVGATDLSISEQGDFKSTSIISFIKGKIYLVKQRNRKERLGKHIEGMYTMGEEYNPEVMYFEDPTKDKDNTSTVQEQFEYVEEKKGYPLPIEKINNNGLNKEARIESTLSTLVAEGKILFNEDDPEQKEVIRQMRQFPDGMNDDALDSLEIGVRKGLELLKQKTSRHKGILTRRREKTSNILGHNYD